MSADAIRRQQIIVETMGRVNDSLKSDANALVSTRGGCVAPEQAYIEFIRHLLELSKKIE